ncbi:MAG: hypothetical protein GY760_14235 [Deltaproteobacteria bacterium]|nr:hypothetical protein [Deltaproteobacteria bacterium]
MPVLKNYDSYWFDYPNDPHGGRIEIQYLNEGKKAELKEKVSPTHAKINEKKKVEIGMDFKTVLTREETAVSYIKDWENFYDGKKVKGYPNGKEMKCNRANKIRFSSEDGFMTFVTECIEEVEGRIKKLKEEEEKNLKTSQDG